MTAALGILMIALAACGSAATSNAPGTANPVSPGTSAPAARPSQPVTWQSGGTWNTDEFPPRSFPGSGSPSVTLPEFRTSDGYARSARVYFGVPLHYQIPSLALDCNNGDTGPIDLDPGKYVIPVAISVTNLVAQQAPALAPQVTVTTPQYSNGVNMSATLLNGTWSEGEGCAGIWNLGANNTDTIYGVISLTPGPSSQSGLSASDLRQATVSIDWVPNPGRNPGDPSVHVITKPLISLLPGNAATWLAAQP
jgi:hypothetical protein